MGDIIYIYFFIFISKIIENTLSTLRIIVVANGRKKLGAILQGMVALVWIFVTGVVIVDINKDLFKVFVFCAGTVVGSYIGSILEEKVALGDNLLICLLICKTNKNIKKYLIKNNLSFNFNKNIYYIYIKRNKVNKISNELKNIDKNITIISQITKKIV